MTMVLGRYIAIFFFWFFHKGGQSEIKSPSRYKSQSSQNRKKRCGFSPETSKRACKACSRPEGTPKSKESCLAYSKEKGPVSFQLETERALTDPERIHSSVQLKAGCQFPTNSFSSVLISVRLVRGINFFCSCL
jgi:hypothetical protein